MNKLFVLILSAFLCLAVPAPSTAANLANPAAQAGDARLAFGVSYFVGGADITNLEVPLMLNRLCGRVTYSPVRYANLGIDFGVALVGVERYSVGMEGGGFDTVPVFDGGIGWSVGGHLKLSTPYINDIMSVVAIGNGNMFRSANKFGAYYGGADISAAGGLQFRIPNFGCVTVGPQLYLMLGANKAYDGESEGKFHNVNNMRLWVAVDHFPEISGINSERKHYVSFEFTASPGIGASSRVPVREFSVSISVGAITGRLYGEGAFDVD